MIYIKSLLKYLFIHATFDSLSYTSMAYVSNMAYTRTTNPRISPRFRQILVLVSTIIIGMLVSVLATV